MARRCLERKRVWAGSSAGYFADIVAVEGDPLADIDVAIYGVRWVMKAGQVMVDKTR